MISAGRGLLLAAPSRAIWTQHIVVAGIVLASAIIVGILPLRQSASLVAGFATAILCLRYPWLVWIGLAFVLPVAASSRVGGIAPTDLLVAAGAFFWSTYAITRRHWEAAPVIPLWPIALYIGVLLTATLGAQDLVEAASEVIKWAEFVAILWIVPSIVPQRAAPWLVAVLLAAAVGQAALGLYQFVFRIGPEWFVIQDRFMRASGSFRQPNPFAGYLGVSLPVAISLLIWSFNRWRHDRTSLRAMACVVLTACAAGLIGMGLVASWSRGGWLGAAAAALVVVALSGRRGALSVAALGVAAIPASFFGALNPTWIPTPIAARLAEIPVFFGAGDLINQPVTDANFAVVERLAHWIAALRMWDHAPWLGIGPGNYNVAYATFALAQWPDPLGHAHNIYLNVLAESGLLGLIAFLIFWMALIIWTTQRMVRLPAVDWRRALAVGVLGVYTHLAIHSLVDNLFVQGIYLHLAFWPATLAIAVPWESENRVC